MPSIRITKYYDGKCGDCGAGTTNAVEAEVERWATEHATEHHSWATAGAALGGKVFNVDAPGLPWFGHIVKASRAAKTAGYRYLTWNGWVYPVDDYPTRVCQTTDVTFEFEGQG